MKIGIIGSGAVGQVLGSAFLSEGNEVMLGTRNPAKEEVVKWKQQNEMGQVGTFENAAAFGETLVLATGGAVTEEAVKLAGVANFSAKTVIDATNPIAPEAPVNGVLKYFTDINESLMERIQRLVPDANLVKAFNSVGNGLMYKPQLGGQVPTMFICGNSAAAKAQVSAILTDFGWEVEDMGSNEAARAIEPLCILWCIPGFQRNEWMHAFKLVKAVRV